MYQNFSEVLQINAWSRSVWRFFFLPLPSWGGCLWGAFRTFYEIFHCTLTIIDYSEYFAHLLVRVFVKFEQCFLFGDWLIKFRWQNRVQFNCQTIFSRTIRISSSFDSLCSTWRTWCNIFSGIPLTEIKRPKFTENRYLQCDIFWWATLLILY